MHRVSDVRTLVAGFHVYILYSIKRIIEFAVGIWYFFKFIKYECDKNVFNYKN